MATRVWADYINRGVVDAEEDADKTVISNYHNTTNYPTELNSLFIVKKYPHGARSNSMKKMSIAIVSILMAGLLVACGGGGGGDDAAPPPASGVSITTANAEVVSAEVTNSVDAVEGVGSGSEIITGVSITANSDGFSYRDFVMAQLEKFTVVRQQQLSSGVVGVVIPAETVPCSGGGTITISGNVADPNLDTLSAGDTLSIVFDNCSEEGSLISGSFELTINAAFDGMLPLNLDVSVIMTGFSVTDPDITFSSDGDMRLVLTEDGIGNFGATFSGNSLTINEGGETVTLSNYNYVLTGNDLSGDYSLDIAGTIDSTILGGSVTFVTVQPFTGNDFNDTDEPTEGVLLMTSNFDSSQARLTAQPDGVNVMIEVDADGDGVFEGTVMTTWDTLESL